MRPCSLFTKRRHKQKDSIVNHDNDNLPKLPDSGDDLKLNQQQLIPLMKLLARNAAKRDYAILLKRHYKTTGEMSQKG